MTRFFTVLHDTNPTFGLTDSVGPYRIVAFGETQLTDESDILEHAFYVTNSIDEPWFTLGDEHHLNHTTETRSTSVGDIVVISSPQGERYYRCENAGWTRVHRPTIIPEPGQTLRPDGEAPWL